MTSTSDSSSSVSWSPVRPTRRGTLSRRLLLLSGGAVGIGAAGLVAGRIVRHERQLSPEATETTTAEANAASSIANPLAEGTGAPADTPIPSPTTSRARLGSLIVPDGLALVTSPRLPLFGVGPDDPDRLLTGKLGDWRGVGSAVRMAVEPLGLVGAIPPGVEPVATYRTYPELAAALGERPGGVALVPLEEIDYRVNVLAVGGVDPLRDGAVNGEPTIRIGVVGDIVPGRNVHLHMEKYGDFVRPFRNVAPHLAAYDLTIANLEGNLSATLPQPSDPHSFTFVSSPAMLEGFLLAGIDAVSLANNHSVWNTMDWGVQGLLDTIAALEAVKLPFFGAGRTLAEARQPWLTEIHGVRIAWLGIDGVTANYEVEPGAINGVLDFDAGAGPDRPGTNPYASAQFLEDIRSAAEQAEIVIPYFHFGQEYVAVPPLWAVNGARAAIDAGATFVVTNHPHVIQGMEIHHEKPIVYSPGNFILDQMWGVEVRSGLILDVTLRGGRVVGLRCHGVEIEEFHQPRLMTAGEQANLMDRFWAATDRQAARGG